MPGRDLFGWRDEADALGMAVAAEEARLAAERKARVAPYGQVRTRQERLTQLTHEALRAEVRLSRLQQGDRP